ncbi:PIN domain-containing protein [Aureispira sp. CCB-E]|uniref:PIN domain-containing protein n=1 Tax=Aureispira sp. CCB-E TaxID=3051121 RepID=UPI0028685E1D|nr:PIN domain-containing protein [Aureispira sp. CCB-E]WMX13219.1 PIN domain-containing protein [Aureispira sp. CCB-E]
MHHLTLDTNTWIYLANGREPVKLLTYLKEEVDKNNITLLLPKTIFEEWHRNKEKQVKKVGLKHFNNVKEALSNIQKLLGKKGERDIFSFLLNEDEDNDYFDDFVKKFNSKKKEIEDAITDNIKLIDDLFKHRNTKIIEIKEEIMLDAGKYALEKKAPFIHKNSFADAIILLSFIDYVETHSIKGAFFISYNTADFCEKKDGKVALHPHLKPLFEKSESKFYKIVGEAINTIEKDIISKEELEYIKELEAEREYEIHYCQLCDEMNGRLNEVYFGQPVELIDERVKAITDDPNQTKFEFAKNLPTPTPEPTHDKLEIGNCSWCNTEHFICACCGTLNAIWDGEYNGIKECEGCGQPYEFEYDRRNEETEYKLLDKTKPCAKCGDEIDIADDSDICSNCEFDYSYN